MTDICAWCLIAGPKSKCPCGVRYCGEACQRKHFAFHRYLCTALKKKVSPPPSRLVLDQNFLSSIQPTVRAECLRLIRIEKELSFGRDVSSKVNFLWQAAELFQWKLSCVDDSKSDTASLLLKSFYTSSGVDTKELKLLNPLLDVYYTPIMKLYEEYGGRPKVQFSIMLGLVDVIAPYLSWVIPTPELLDTIIKRHSKIVDVGAGTGYLSRLLLEHKADVVAIDDSSNVENIKKGVHGLYSPVINANMINYCKSGAADDRALLFSWPDQHALADCLHAINEWKGNVIFYIGSHSTAPLYDVLVKGKLEKVDPLKSIMKTEEEIQKEVLALRKSVPNVFKSKWNLEHTLCLPSWPTMDDCLYIIVRQSS